MQTKELVNTFITITEQFNIPLDMFNLYLCTNTISVEIAEECDLGAWLVCNEDGWGDELSTVDDMENFCRKVLYLQKAFEENYNL